MKKLTLLLPILLMACAPEKPSPTIIDSYFAARYSYTVVLAGAVAYKDVCIKQPAANHCHAVVLKLRQLDKAVEAAEKDMQKAQLSGNESNQKIALAALIGAIDTAKTYKEENVK